MNRNNNNNAEVPEALRVWFVIHFVVDIVFALPLMVAPELLLGTFVAFNFVWIYWRRRIGKIVAETAIP